MRGVEEFVFFELHRFCERIEIMKYVFTNFLELYNNSFAGAI